MEVFQHENSDNLMKVKSIIRAGMSLFGMAKSGEEDKVKKLQESLSCCAKADEILAADRSLPPDLLHSVKILRKQISGVSHFRHGIFHGVEMASRVLQLLLNPLEKIQELYVVTPHYVLYYGYCEQAL
jgi:hypothetical protein